MQSFSPLFLVKHSEERRKNSLAWLLLSFILRHIIFLLICFILEKPNYCHARSVTECCYYFNPCSRWSTFMPTRLLLWEQRTSVLPASTPRRPCTLASACSATPCLTGKFSQSPSVVSLTAPLSSSATTGRSRASYMPLQGSVCL